jgi:tRNA A37 threonylcarbamoyladenosine synthetase subunit TsaC/SUA5/YrdC
VTDKQKDYTTVKTPLKGVFSNDVKIISAAQALSEGEPIVVDDGCVFAICFNGANPVAVQKVYEAKQRPKQQKFALTQSTKWFTNMIDISKVSY